MNQQSKKASWQLPSGRGSRSGRGNLRLLPLSLAPDASCSTARPASASATRTEALARAATVRSDESAPATIPLRVRVVGANLARNATGSVAIEIARQLERDTEVVHNRSALDETQRVHDSIELCVPSADKTRSFSVSLAALGLRRATLHVVA